MNTGDILLTSAVVSNLDTQTILFWLAIIGGLVIISVIISRSYSAMGLTATPSNIEAVKAQQRAIFEAKLSKQFKDRKTLIQAIQQQNVSDRENCLINFQPLTVIHPGYLGPAKDGVYDEALGVLTGIRMGARCFVLPIDYHDKDSMPPSFPAAKKPCLLFRDGSDTIRSLNGGSIQKVAQAIADAAWSDSTNQRNDPLILVLYFVRTPPEGTKEYLNFLSEVARNLQPLLPYLLGQTPEGVYNRQGRQDQLLFVNSTNFEKKLLVFCNANTAGFRTAQRDFKKTFLPKEDLDYWVHMRINKQNPETPLGVTQTPESGGIPRSYVENMSYFTSYPSDAASKRKAIQMTKEKFMISLSPNGMLPELRSAQTALNEYGVQAVPLFITDDSPEVDALLGEWKYSWRAKPKAIRYVRPEPQVIPEQSKKVDANQGKLTVPR
jgi:hypothetical protein